MFFPYHDTDTKVAFDILAAATAAGAFLDVLPPLSAILVIIYTTIRIYESYTIQRVIAKLLKKQPPHPSQNPD